MEMLAKQSWILETKSMYIFYIYTYNWFQQGSEATMWFSGFSLEARRVNKQTKSPQPPKLHHLNPTIRDVWGLRASDPWLVFSDNAKLWNFFISPYSDRVPGGKTDPMFVCIICVLHLTDTRRNRKIDSWWRPQWYWKGCLSAQVFHKVFLW